MGKKETIGKLVLLALEKAVDGYVRLEDFAYHHYRYHHGIPELRKASLAQALKRLREKGFIERTTLKNADQIILRLTEAGKEFLLLSKSDEEIEWDRKWRIVVFDIPEKKRQVRDILRSRLKLWGFTPWQQSVWASRKNLTNKLRNLIEELGIEDWVLVIESDNTGKRAR
ncbi:MAG: winged helix-turn-helix transcriptional regulator [Candidatus Daviesbacteria bacterium]|nr:winged helix-turn-helix transcriptional regulator [Candidatus Daviesbacteria bacterium]